MTGTARRRRSLAILVLVFIGFSMLMKVPTLIFEHDEPDELIYWAVAENMAERGEYTLRGSPLLEHLSPRIYDRPLFHHPPLYVALLLPFVVLDSPSLAVTISWIGHALCILAVALIGSALLREDEASAAGLRQFLWIPLLAVATDPLLAFASRKLWIDVLVSGLVALTLALLFRARRARSRRTAWLLGAGVVLGLAGLAKLPGLMAGLVGMLVLVVGDDRPRDKLRQVALYLAPAVAIMLPWFITFFATYGTFAPDWLKPDEVTFRHSRFVTQAVALPWFYYLVKLCIVQPLVPVVAVAYGLSLRRGLSFDRWMPAIWFLVFLAVPTLQGVTGYGFQMRYVAPLMTGVYAGMLCLPGLIDRQGARIRTQLLVLVILYAAMGGAMYLLDSRYDELLSIPELMGVLDFLR
jgi:4-amino-4-deoxy-L-arabinose transferase-like glycosyltransferase